MHELILASSISSSLVPMYYVIGILAVVMSGLWALKQYLDKQKQLWTQQGGKEQQLADKLDANIAATNQNTASIERLSARLEEFAKNVDGKLNMHDYRIGRLEDQVSNGVHPSRQRPSQ